MGLLLEPPKAPTSPHVAIPAPTGAEWATDTQEPVQEIRTERRSAFCVLLKRTDVRSQWRVTHTGAAKAAPGA